MFYIDEINPQCKGDLSCGKPSSYTIFIRTVQSYSCEWLKHTSENGGTPPTVASVTGDFGKSRAGDGGATVERLVKILTENMLPAVV